MSSLFLSLVSFFYLCSFFLIFAPKHTNEKPVVASRDSQQTVGLVVGLLAIQNVVLPITIFLPVWKEMGQLSQDFVIGLAIVQ